MIYISFKNLPLAKHKMPANSNKPPRVEFAGKAITPITQPNAPIDNNVLLMFMYK